MRDELTNPAGANVQWTFGERTERPCARLTKCNMYYLHELDNGLQFNFLPPSTFTFLPSTNEVDCKGDKSLKGLLGYGVIAKKPGLGESGI
jgi:hypothetical protein